MLLVREKIIFVALSIVFLIACKKDSAVIATDDPANNYFANKLIAGSGITSFQRIIGGKYGDNLNSVKQTNDGGYIFCGNIGNKSGAVSDGFVLKTNAKGESIWDLKFTMAYSCDASCIENSNDGGFVTGINANKVNPNSGGAAKGVCKLVKLNANGDSVWVKAYAGITKIYKIKQADDGGYLLIVHENNPVGYNLILKVNGEGNELWRSSFNSYYCFKSVCKTSDGGFVLAGYKSEAINAMNHSYLVRINANGDTLWTKNFNDSTHALIKDVCQTTAGNFSVCGIKNVQYGFARLLDSNGNLIWEKVFSSPYIYQLSSIIATSDQQIIAVGYQFFAPANAELIKIDLNGATSWIKTFNPASFACFNEVQRTGDNGFIISGCTAEDGYIVKTDANGN